MSNDVYWNIIEQAKVNTMYWAKEQGTPIFKIEYVATFEEWDNGIGVYIFFRTEEEKNRAIKFGINIQIKQYYLSLLKELKYPFDKYYDIIFSFDSDENVKKNYEGSYFFRVR